MAHMAPYNRAFERGLAGDRTLSMLLPRQGLKEYHALASIGLIVACLDQDPATRLIKWALREVRMVTSILCAQKVIILLRRDRTVV